MTLDRELLARYLRQRAEMGEVEIFLDRLSADTALALAAGTHVAAVPAARTAVVREVRQAALAELPQLKLLRENALSCVTCRLHETRTTVVFGEGSSTAEVMVVGEAPGSEEDRTGRPFVGAAGKLLDVLLMSAGFPREQVYICNVLKCRPPQNRDPLPDEVESCSGYLRGQLELIKPKVVVALGNFAARSLLSTERGISKLRRQVHTFQGIPLVATFHPAFLLRSPQWTRSAWQDFQLVRQVLDEQA
jgi:uracil-DNA glycosylase family 4